MEVRVMGEEQRIGKLGGIGQAFADRNFRIYSIGSIASWTSFFVQLVAVSWLAWELTGSTVWLAVVAMMDIIPNVVLMPLAGALADRFDRYKILLLTSFLALLQSAAMAVLAWTGELTIWPLTFLVLMHGIIIAFMVPAMYGTLPRFVARKRLSSAIAVSSAYTQFSVFAGPALAGLIITQYGITPAFVVNAGGYFMLLVSLFFLRTPSDFKSPEPSNNTILKDVIDGFDYILKHRTISSLLLMGLAISALTNGFFHMLPAYSDQILGMGVVGVSTILAFEGIGATVAALWLAHGGSSAMRLNRWLWAGLVIILGHVALVMTGNLYVAVALSLGLGIANEIKRTTALSLIQFLVDENQRGRVMGTQFMLSQLAAGFGALSIGFIAHRAGLVAPVIGFAAIASFVWLWIYVRRKTLIQKIED